MFNSTMPTIFSRIIAGEIPCYKVYEDDYVFAFLDIKPHQLGHTLIVPKIEVDSFVDVPEPYYSTVFNVAKKLAPAIQKATGCARVGAVIMGFEVPHFHYHLIPMIEIGDICPDRARPRSEEEMRTIHQKILNALKRP